jgi:fumarylacetoacetate (FAA) hydrolase
MKLASLDNGRPDGRLVVVSKDLKTCVSAGHIAPTLQAALDIWETAAPKLSLLALQLQKGEVAGEPFDPLHALAPLPRAFQWIDCAAYLGHLERVRTLKGSRAVDLQSERPLMYQGASDGLSAGHAPISAPEADLAVDFEAELAVVLGPVPMAVQKPLAASAIRLIALCNDVSYRRLVHDDLSNGFGFFHSKPSTSFAPVVVTPDELGDAWHEQRAHVRVRVEVNAKPFGELDAGADMDFDFADLIVAAAKTRRLGCGTILGAGTIANRHDAPAGNGKKTSGYACIAEARTTEKASFGTARTPFLRAGDRVRIEAFDAGGGSLFGAINQSVEIVGGI